MRGNIILPLLLLLLVLTATITPTSAEQYTLNFTVEDGSDYDSDSNNSIEMPDITEPPKKDVPKETSSGGGGFYMPPAENNSSTTNETNVTTVIEEPVVIVEPEPPRVQPPVTEPEATPAEPSAMTASDALLPGAIKVVVIGLGLVALLTVLYVSRSFISSMWSRKGREDDEEYKEE